MRLRISVFVFACLAAAACSGQAGVTSIGARQAAAQPGPGVQTAAPSLFVADTANNAVDTFGSNQSGDIAPSSSIQGADTLLASPNGVAVAHDGTIYVANNGASPSISVYAPGSTGDAIPTRTISCGGLSGPAGISLDNAGDVYVANSTGKSISVFVPTDSGCVSGNRTIVGIHTCIFSPQDVDVRRDGTLYVASSSAVLVFRPGAHGDATPVQKITGSNTLLLPRVVGVSIDSSQNIYATSGSLHKHGLVTVYAPTATGNVAPLWTIAGPATTLDAVDKIELDPKNQVFVTNGAAMDVFAAGASGDVAPVQAITGPTTTLVSPAGLDIQP
jgi:hypothetical protein